MSLKFETSELTANEIVTTYIHLIVKEHFIAANRYKKQLRKDANRKLENVAGSSNFWKADMGADRFSNYYDNKLIDLNTLDKEYGWFSKIEYNDSRYNFLSKYEDVLEDYRTRFPVKEEVE